MRRRTIGSIDVTFPNLTSGMYKAQTTWAQPPVSVRFNAPDLDGQSSHLCNKIKVNNC